MHSCSESLACPMAGEAANVCPPYSLFAAPERETSKRSCVRPVHRALSQGREDDEGRSHFIDLAHGDGESEPSPVGRAWSFWQMWPGRGGVQKKGRVRPCPSRASGLDVQDLLMPGRKDAKHAISGGGDCHLPGLSHGCPAEERFLQGYSRGGKRKTS